jgi:hypothetical protein
MLAGMKMLAGIVAALAVGATGAHAQDVYVGAPPYPYAVAPYSVPQVVMAPVPAPGIVVAPAPYAGAYIPQPYYGPVVVNPYTGRWCTLEPSGWRWCWTP